MKKEEILAKAKKENKMQDEREKYIEEKGQSNAFTVIILVFAVLTVFSFIQKVISGHSFVDSNVFILALLLGSCGKFATMYYYNKQKSDLLWTIAAILGAICMGIAIILNGMGWKTV